MMSWWGLFAFVLAIPFLLYGLFRWASADPGIQRDIAKDRFLSKNLELSGGPAETIDLI
jgi:hypothetical protein